MTTSRFATREALIAALETWSLELVNMISKFRSGMIRIEIGSSALFINVHEFSPNSFGISVQGYVLGGLSRSEELALAVLTEEDYSNYYAGGWAIAKFDDADESSHVLQYQVALFGAQLDQSEFEDAVRLVALVTDTHDEALQARFGGKLWSET